MMTVFAMASDSKVGARFEAAGLLTHWQVAAEAAEFKFGKQCRNVDTPSFPR
jgi:hypothetical protein